jgi:pyruvate dehydrogenase E2 component (dihydrolipoamide acetyltransferase)
VLAKPPVRKLAKDRGVDLGTVTPTGPGGLVTRADVEAAAAAQQRHDTAAAPAAPAAAEQRIPVRSVRKATAEAVTRSAFTAPHVTEWVTVDVSEAMSLLERLRARREYAAVKVTPLTLVVRAMALAARRTPEVNSHWVDLADGQAEIVQPAALHLGVATATPRGLLVPVVRNVDALDLATLAGAITSVVEKARAGATAPADTTGGTMAVTNVGVFGVDGGTPILVPGQSAILAVGQVARRPWVVGTGRDERLEPRWVTTLALSFDHRVVDGEQGSRFLADVAALLHDPALALAG